MSLRIRALSTAAVAVAMAAVAHGQGRITGVDVVNTTSGIDVVITGKDLAKPKEIKLLEGQSYIAEFDASLDIKGFRRRVDVAGVRSVETGWYSSKPPKVRVHLRVNQGIEPAIVEEGGKFILRVGPPKPADLTKITNTMPTAKASSADDFPTGIAPLAPVNLSPAPLKPTDKVEPKTETKTDVKPAPLPAPGAAQTPPPAGAKPQPRPAAPEKKVNLEFVGADVVQVLRALSGEAGVNIVTAPDVSPQDRPSRLTVSLKGVTVSEALTYVTVMSNLRFAKLNNTFFVTRSENFATTMREFFRGDASRFDTRVVNLVSGEGLSIRQAVLAAFPQDGDNGFYDILDPQATQAPKSQPTAAPAATGGAQGDKPAPSPNLPVWLGGDPMNTQAQAQAQPASKTGMKVSYLMLLGDTRRLDAVETAIKDMDRQVARSFSVSKSDDTGAEAVPILSGQTKQIRDMLEKLLDGNPRRGDFTFNESSLRELQEGDLTTNVLLMIGPKKDLEVLKQYAQALDENLCRTAGIAYSKDINDLDRVYEVVDLKYIEPALAAFDLKNRIRGLYVTALPDPVTPTETGLGTQKDEKNDQTKAPDGQGQQQQAKKDELEKVIGREPMKLVLRGTKKQIEEAKSYLAMVDVQPKQVAFEIRVLELTREEAMRMGLDWSLVTGGRLQNFRFNQGTGDTASSPGTISGGYRYRANDVVNFLAALDQSNNGRRIIARPNALVTDGRATRIFVGDTIRYIESIQSNQNGVTIQTNSLDVGVSMRFMARIGSEGNIALRLEQNFNILNGFTPVPGGGQLPQTSERRAENFVNMKTGEIVAFGGLLLEQERKRVSGIPILKDLPILGPFFSRTEREKEKTEIVFLLAAVEVTDGNRADAASPRKAATNSPDPVKDYLRTGSGNPPR